jgi:hypothetical protein
MKTFWQIWWVPMVLGVLTVFGLLAALLGIGVWHWLSWLSLALPIAVVAWYLRQVRQRRKQSKAAMS